jgi:hypothetical protein
MSSARPCRANRLEGRKASSDRVDRASCRDVNASASFQKRLLQTLARTARLFGVQSARISMSLSVSKLGLAAAQFGLDGMSASPRARSYPEAEARDILNIAARARLSVLDASGNYGRAEQVLGDLIPRPVPFRVTLSAARADRGPDFVEAEARATLRRLGVERADAIIVHRPRSCSAARRGPLGPPGPPARRGPVRQDRRRRPRQRRSGRRRPPLQARHSASSGQPARPAPAGRRLAATHRRHGRRGATALDLPERPAVPAARSRPGPAEGRLGPPVAVRRMIAEGRSDPLQAALGFALSRVEGQRRPGGRHLGRRAVGRGRRRLQPAAGPRLGRHGHRRSGGPRPATLGRLTTQANCAVGLVSLVPVN